jgi:hypothetical protein
VDKRSRGGTAAAAVRNPNDSQLQDIIYWVDTCSIVVVFPVVVVDNVILHLLLDDTELLRKQKIDSSFFTRFLSSEV